MPPRTGTRPPPKASRRPGPAPGPQRVLEAEARLPQPSTRPVLRATRSTPAGPRTTQGRCGPGPTGRRLCYGAAFCWRHAAGGGAGSRGLLGPEDRYSAPVCCVAARAGVCRSLLGRLWRRLGASRAGPGPGRRPEGACAATRGGAGLGRAGPAWAELARARAASSLSSASCRGRSYGPCTRKPRVLESEFSEVAKAGRDDGLLIRGCYTNCFSCERSEPVPLARLSFLSLARSGGAVS